MHFFKQGNPKIGSASDSLAAQQIRILGQLLYNSLGLLLVVTKWLQKFQTTHLHRFCWSVTKSCVTPCNPMDFSMPGFPVLHYLPGFAPSHVH